MERYKFRAKSDGQWVYGSHVKTGVGLHYIIPQNLISNDVMQFKVNKDTVCQFTGLKDDNGKDIYEGDIIKRYYPTTSLNEFIGAVEYHDGTYFLIGEDREYDVTFLYDDTTKNTVEVIGNIHDNPELLENVG